MSRPRSSASTSLATGTRHRECARRIVAFAAGLTALASLGLLPGCGNAEPQNVAPPLPPLDLRPMLPELKALLKPPVEPAEPVRRELEELRDIALQLVEADPRTAGRAERSLIEHDRADWVLVPALKHEQPAVRRRAAWLCGRTGKQAFLWPLLLRWKDESDAETALWIADALHHCGNDAGLGQLDAAMDLAATAERGGLMAIEILRDAGARLGDSPTYVELQSGLRERTRAWLATGLGCRKGTLPAPESLVSSIVAAHLVATEGTALRPVDEARFVLVRSGNLALPLLRRTLHASEPYLRTMALQVLAEIGTPARDLAGDALPLLADPLTATYAMRTLGELGATAAAAQIRPALSALDTETRAAAAHALGLLRDQASRPALAAAMGDGANSMDLRVQAAFALLCFGQEAAATAFLAEREQKGDYHAPTIARLRDRLTRLRPD